MAYTGWSLPPQEGIEKNKLKEPEGERIRAELTDFLERNRICGAIIETRHHITRIDFGSRLPSELREVLSYHGGVHVVVSDDVEWERPNDSVQREYFKRGREWEIAEYKRHLHHTPQIPGVCSWCQFEVVSGTSRGREDK